MQALKVRKVGNSHRLALPKEAAARLKVGAGDVVYSTDAQDGCRASP